MEHRVNPADAVRAELRSALADLADALLAHVGRHRVLDAVRHVWILADLAEVEEGLLRVLLRNLARDLRETGTTDASYYAQQLTLAADRL